MEEQTKVPAEIASIIDQKRQAMQAERQRLEEEESRKVNAAIEKGIVIWQDYLNTVVEAVPVWLWPYKESDDIDFERMGHGWEKPASRSLCFDVPGLAPILFDAEKNRWKTPFAVWDQWEDSKPHFSYNSQWFDDLQRVLLDAEETQQNLEELERQYSEKMISKSQYSEGAAKREQESETRRAAEHAAEQAVRESEERILFNLFKDDPVAMNLMKAFLMINQERTTFNAQLEDANETMYSIEQRWTRRAEDLRRQAEHAQRMADEERDRASNLQYDLDDAEGKLKKAQRGW